MTQAVRKLRRAERLLSVLAIVIAICGVLAMLGVLALLALGWWGPPMSPDQFFPIYGILPVAIWVTALFLAVEAFAALLYGGAAFLAGQAARLEGPAHQP